MVEYEVECDACGEIELQKTFGYLKDFISGHVECFSDDVTPAFYVKVIRD